MFTNDDVGHVAYVGFPADASAEEGEAPYAELVRIYCEAPRTLLDAAR